MARFSTFGGVSFDMRDLQYNSLEESDFTYPSEASSHSLNYAWAGGVSYPPPVFTGIGIHDIGLVYGGDFEVDYIVDGDPGEGVEAVSGTVTSYYYYVEVNTSIDVSDTSMGVSISDFSADISLFRTLTDDQISEYIFSSNDTIQAFSSRGEVLLGFAGDDVITGGGGADILFGGDGLDTADYSTATSGLYASLANPSINTGDAAGDEYHDIENLTGTDFSDALNGSNVANVIDGDDGNDALKGYGGNDELLGGTGNDTLIGGAGADVLSGGLGSDTVSYAGATAGVYASLANASINTKDASGDSYLSVENLTGSSHDDRLNGSNIDNTLVGGDGNDLIKGYAGNDTLTGGAGSDTFIFNSTLDAVNNVDLITDFSVADDTIQLDDAFFSEVGPMGTLAFSTFRYNTSGNAEAAEDRIIYESDTGKLVYDADGNGSGAGIHFATLAPNLLLSGLDFVVI